MNWKHIISSGTGTGAILAIFILLVFVLSGLDPGSFAGLCGGFLALSALSAIIINKISNIMTWPEVNLKILIPIGFFTSVIPLLGPLLGLPNTNPITLATVVALGAVGGAFWSLP
ncbi:MAG: hypothetical protein VYC11_02085, partial [Candidatus Thermoplasmatota archaeon]|nr:hypothetical protein [Candidatus Thermoplasmatota archaeon]